MRICASVRSDTCWSGTICISSPHRHSGNSLEPGINCRSITACSPSRRTDGFDCILLVCSTSLTLSVDVLRQGCTTKKKSPDQSDRNFEVANRSNGGDNLEGTAPKIARTILQASANGEWRRDCLAALSKSDITRPDQTDSGTHRASISINRNRVLRESRL